MCAESMRGYAGSLWDICGKYAGVCGMCSLFSLYLSLSPLFSLCLSLPRSLSLSFFPHTSAYPRQLRGSMREVCSPPGGPQGVPPNWTPNGPQHGFKMDLKMVPKLTPKRSKNCQNWTPSGPLGAILNVKKSMCLAFFASWAVLGPPWAPRGLQEAPKRPPKGPQEAPGRPNHCA